MPRLSIFIQYLSFALAVLSPTGLLALNFQPATILTVTGYSWAVGIAAAVWDWVVWRRKE